MRTKSLSDKSVGAKDETKSKNFEVISSISDLPLLDLKTDPDYLTMKQKAKMRLASDLT